MANINRFTRPLLDLDTFHVFNDFDKDQADTDAVDTVTDTGTVAMGDAAAGTVVLTPSDGTVVDNDEAYLATPNEVFIFAAGKSLYGQCRLKFVETAAGIYNVAFGFQNAVGANSIVDNTGLPKASGSTLAIYKTDGSSVWKVCSACNGTATHTTSTKAAVTATWYVLEIICQDWDGTSMSVTFKVDGELLKDSNGNVIRHTVAIASATEMQMFVGCKLGADTNNDATTVDYWYGAQQR